MLRRSQVIIVGLVVCFHQVAMATAPEPKATRAVAAVAALKVALKQELEQAIAAGGLEGAVLVCRERAPALAKEVGAKHGVVVGRTSHRLRSAANAPRAWVKPIVDEWLKASPAERKPRAIALDATMTGYIEPIATGALCLACHGEHVGAATLAKIKAAYPGDRATGFKEGDLRGVFWAEEKTAAK